MAPLRAESTERIALRKAGLLRSPCTRLVRRTVYLWQTSVLKPNTLDVGEENGPGPTHPRKTIPALGTDRLSGPGDQPDPPVPGAGHPPEWVSDDSFIAFRTVDNIIHGYGLTRNVDERVQAFTHLPWMFLLLAGNAITHEFVFMIVGLMIALTALALNLYSRLGAGLSAAGWPDGVRVCYNQGKGTG